MFYNDEHPPPHFHAQYNEHEALINIHPLKLSKGSLPKAQERLVIEWAIPQVEFLMETWYEHRQKDIERVT